MLAVVIAVLAAPFSHAGGSPPVAPFDDAAFVKAVAVGGMYEGRLCYLVGAQSRNSELRRFAAAVVADRLVGSAGLKEIAKDAGIELPAKLDDTHQKMYEEYKEYKGEDLERDFVKTMAQRHAAAVALFTRASKEAKNPAIKEFAAATLPRLQKHMQEAKNLDR